MMRFNDRFATFNALQQQSCDAWLELRARGLAIVCKHQSGDLLTKRNVASLTGAAPTCRRLTRLAQPAT
jgi:hypothetical protein